MNTPMIETRSPLRAEPRRDHPPRAEVAATISRVIAVAACTSPVRLPPGAAVRFGNSLRHGFLEKLCVIACEGQHAHRNAFVADEEIVRTGDEHRRIILTSTAKAARDFFFHHGHLRHGISPNAGSLSPAEKRMKSLRQNSCALSSNHMGEVVPFRQKTRKPEEPPEPFEFSFRMWGRYEDEISLETQFNRSPETIPRLPELLRILATRIELGNL